MSNALRSIGWAAILLVGCDGAHQGALPPAIDRSLTDASVSQSRGESYDAIAENPFVVALQQPQSTFAIDVDTASYSNIRRMLHSSQLPPKGAVRLEECVNYFSYNYPEPDDKHPFSVVVDRAECPWQPGHQLVRVALRGRSVNSQTRPPCNLVFLVDVSGSMASDTKLPLVQWSLKLLSRQLDARDRIAIVAYAGNAGVVLPPTRADQLGKIVGAIDELSANGSTNGAGGIRGAYQLAKEHFDADATNRVILCTDGDFNVGISNQSDLIDLITEQAKSNIFLSVLGFGMGNLQDSTLEKLADHGNGNYAYIDNQAEARKVFQQEMGGTLVTIAKDVKIQVDFNPRLVKAYRLLGYENRAMTNEEFRNDEKDAGEIGAGHTVTAFYEVAPVGSQEVQVVSRTSEFVQPQVTEDQDTLLTVNVRYKHPLDSQARELQQRLPERSPTANDGDFRFASAVLAFGMLLRDSSYKGNLTWDWIIDTAQSVKTSEQRAEFIELVNLAKRLSK